MHRVIYCQSLTRLTDCARTSARILGHLGGPGKTAQNPCGCEFHSGKRLYVERSSRQPGQNRNDATLDATAEDNPNTLQQIGMPFDVSIQVLGDLTPPVRDKRWRSSNIDHQTEALPSLPQFRNSVQMGRELL